MGIVSFGAFFFLIGCFADLPGRIAYERYWTESVLCHLHSLIPPEAISPANLTVSLNGIVLLLRCVFI